MMVTKLTHGRSDVCEAVSFVTYSSQRSVWVARAQVFSLVVGFRP